MSEQIYREMNKRLHQARQQRFVIEWSYSDQPDAGKMYSEVYADSAAEAKGKFVFYSRHNPNIRVRAVLHEAYAGDGTDYIPR